MSDGHSLNDEPHLRPIAQTSNDHGISNENNLPTPLAPGDGVGDEPGVQTPVGAKTYRDHLASRYIGTTAAKTWLFTLIAVLAAGPWAILAAIFGTSASTQAVTIVVFGPLCEEVAKIAIPFLIVERWPWLFRWRFQVLISAVAGGLVFSVIENFIYLNVYFPNPDPWMVQWRWTVCVALHSGCSLVAGLGITRVWSGVWRDHRPPDGNYAIPYLAAAALIHGLYNFLALTGETLAH
jgi:hypothetical protein